MKKLIIMTMAAFLLSGCADSVSFSDAANIDPVGFLHGLWHGFTCFFSFFGSLFSDEIAIYAIYNNGGWYDFGFLLGAGALTSSATSGKK